MRFLVPALALLSLPLAGQAPPKLDLNAATAAQLQSIPGVGPTTAQRIVRIRERNGPYRCIEELHAVPRLTEAQFEAIRERVQVLEPDSRCEETNGSRRAGRPVHPGA